MPPSLLAILQDRVHTGCLRLAYRRRAVKATRAGMMTQNGRVENMLPT